MNKIKIVKSIRHSINGKYAVPANLSPGPSRYGGMVEEFKEQMEILEEPTRALHAIDTVAISRQRKNQATIHRALKITPGP